ncbi:probable ubiquitin carboxyl-terminal hydrolase FAF-X, partial [Paramuricea clavata]
MPSSPDSSSDSSGSPPTASDGPNIEAERCLPGVIIATRTKFVASFLQIAEFSIQFNIPELREEVWCLLGIVPTDGSMADNMRKACSYKAEKEVTSGSQLLQAFFNSASSAQTVYNLEILYSLLMPAGQLFRERVSDFQMGFFKSGGVQCVLNLITKTNFLELADTWTKRSAYLTLMKIAKFALTTVAYAKVYLVAEAMRPESRSQISSETQEAAVILQQALQCIPDFILEYVLKNYALSLGHHNAEE